MGRITKLLLDKWSQNVGINIIEQIKAFNKEIDVADGTTPYRFSTENN